MNDLRVATRSGRTKNTKKVRKKWGFLKKVRKFEKRQIFSVQIYEIPFFLKPSNGEN